MNVRESISCKYVRKATRVSKRERERERGEGKDEKSMLEREK